MTILEQFNECRTAVINPNMLYSTRPEFQETVVTVFSRELFDKVLAFLGGTVIATTRDVDGIWPIYEVNYKGKRFAFCKARLAFELACRITA
jgi:hypothetical protein